MKPKISLSSLKGFLGRRLKAERKVSPLEESSLFVTGITGIKPKNPKIFLQAFTHKSYPSAKWQNNERLEFLGDSVLNLSVSHLLFELYPDDDEGSLSQLRSYLTNRNNLNQEARQMGLDRVLRTAAGTDLQNSDILGNAFEAFIGALFIETGMDFTSKFIRKRLIISRKNMETVSLKEEDFKTEFIILMQKHKIPYTYNYLGNRLSDKGIILHKFELLIGSDNFIIAEGEAGNKKAAHQIVSQIALRKLSEDNDLLRTLITQKDN